MRKYLPEGYNAQKDEFLYSQTGFSESSLVLAAQSGAILEAKAVLCDNAHNLHIDLGCMKGFMPREEAALGIIDGSTRDIAIISRVNKSVCFKITGFGNQNGEKIAFLSRKIAQEECYENYISHLIPGDIIDAAVTYNENFGSFADIGCGINSLMHIDSISVSRISHPSDRFITGHKIKAAVKSSDAQGRIYLTHKELLGTWEENAANYSAGQTVTGIIRSVEDYGIFVELTPNLAGLAELRGGVREGQTASVYIKSVIPDKMKVKLIIVEVSDAKPRPPEKYNYFETGSRIDRWQYSPVCCQKYIGTDFSMENECQTIFNML